MEHFCLGKPPPKDRKHYGTALDLVHASKTGDFPFPGGLREQPERLAVTYRLVLGLLCVADHLAVVSNLGAVGGGTQHNDQAPVGGSGPKPGIVGWGKRSRPE